MQQPPPPTTLAMMTMAADPEIAIRPGEIVELRFARGKSLSVLSHKLWHALIDHAGKAVADRIEHTISLAVINWAHASRGDLVEAIRELQTTIVEIEITSRRGRPAVRSGPLLTDVIRETDSDGELVYAFSDTVRYAISNSNHWAALSRRAVFAFESKYSLRLYELLALRKNLQHKMIETWTIADLRRALGVPGGKLERWQDFKRKVIEHALAEISHLTEIEARYTPVKTGRAVTAVKIAWGKKDARGLAAAKAELDQPKVGRTARRKGTVDAIADERAAAQHLRKSLIARPATDSDLGEQ
jgi:hypothetical protein